MAHRVLSSPARVLGSPRSGPIARVVLSEGLAVPELWNGSGWTREGTGGLLAEMLPGRSFELTPEELDAEGIPRSDAEES